jgi:hypothetical protein
MNKHVKISLIVLVAVVLLLALTVPGLAKRPDKSFVLEFDMDYVDWDNFWSTGTFHSVEGSITDSGTTYGHWNPFWGSAKGTMILQSSDEVSQIVITYTVPFEKPCTTGHFTIWDTKNTGEYAGMGGVGKIEICRHDNGTPDLYSDDTTYGSLVGLVIYR